MRVIRVVAGLAVAMVAIAQFGERGAAQAPDECSTRPQDAALVLTYRLEAGSERLDEATRNDTAAILCERLGALDHPDGEVRIIGPDTVRLTLARSPSLRRVARWIAASGQLRFYDWEANLIGRERLLGGRPHLAPPPALWRSVQREWKAANRNVRRSAELGLMLEGAFPTPYGAVRLASKQRPRKHCERCIASTPRFFLFDRSPSHDLLAGPADSRADLRRAARGRKGLVLKVPVGTVVVAEDPISASGRPIETIAPGWFALRDRGAITENDIVDPEAARDAVGGPVVVFGFTADGRRAFQRMTRKIARRGAARAAGPVTLETAEALSGRFAVVLDNQLLTKPIVNFAENPDGIDGRIGAQVSGLTARAASDLTTILRSSSLPLAMTLVRVKPLAE
jgi:SecD/SecF fusion protein